MNFKMTVLEQEQIVCFKHDMQEAFQYGFEVEYGKSDELVLPEKDIDESLKTDGAIAYAAFVDDEMVGGAVVTIDKETQHNHLDFLYVKVGCHSKGIGQEIWKQVEGLHPETKVWETCTPYFEKRNIHFYVNCCGFHIVKFYNPRFKDPRVSDEPVGGMPEEAGDYFFEFEKVMK